MLFGEKIAYKEVKFLRLILDEKLNCNTQIERVINRARISLLTSRSMIETTERPIGILYRESDVWE